LSKLQLWQERLERNQSAYDAAKMDERETLYAGTEKLHKIVAGDTKKKTVHVRNVVSELIEAQVDSNIPQPKVTPMREQDEMLAKKIEDYIRNELDRMPFEQFNDMMERTVPIQGGGLFLVEWDNTKRTHSTVGELSVKVLHPKNIVPQDGVFTSIEDMDYIILKLPQTKEYIKQKYGKDVGKESESEPEIKGLDVETSDDLVTQYIAYYRNSKGGIGLYSWVNDTELEDTEDYQARRLKRCKKCGSYEPTDTYESLPTLDGERPEPIRKADGKKCPYCGGKYESVVEEYQELYAPIRTSNGVIPAEKPELTGRLDEFGYPEVTKKPVKIPYYKPDVYPVVLQKNVSVYGQLLGDSDVDKIADQQNTTNRLENKIIDLILGGGSYITLPARAEVDQNPDDLKVIRVDDPKDRDLISVQSLQGDIQQPMIYLNQIYEEARQAIGITDSYQGRRDPTATSGVAKQFAATQSAGRLESKRVMKRAAYAALFEVMFKFMLAYADEPRPIVSKDKSGTTEYGEFNRYDFLEQDETGEWYWNDRFIFSCDTSAPLANNREAMWQETRLNLQTGAFGDPTNIETLILFWTKMEMLHYPGAAETKSYLQEKLEQQQAMQYAAANAEKEVRSVIDNQARQDAIMAVQNQGRGVQM